MRATVEISDDQWARLKAIAASRGEKGYSNVLHEAIALYLKQEDEAEREERKRRALAAFGSISDEEAEALHAHVRELRSRWRQP